MCESLVERAAHGVSVPREQGRAQQSDVAQRRIGDQAFQVALSGIKNVHITAVLIILTAVFFGWRCMYSIAVFIMLEGFFWGFAMWWFCYWYLWPILGIAAVLMRKNDSALVWAIVAAVHGLIFGALCSIPYLFIGGWTMALSYWVSGIPFDLIHCGGNFVMTLVLYKPLKKGMEYALHGKTKKTLPEEKPET